MNEQQYNYFEMFRKNFRSYCSEWNNFFDELSFLQKKAAMADNVPEYRIENPVVYNTALDTITRQSDIRLIVVADNPGKTEQLNNHREYLVGQAGKIASGFFRQHAELTIDFRKNVIILNKTPVHSAKTKELAYIIKNASAPLAKKIAQSISWSAEKTAQLHTHLITHATNDNEQPCMLWFVGYGELKAKGIFSHYATTIKDLYASCAPHIRESVMVYQHFSMNRFIVDLKKQSVPSLTLTENLKNIGQKHRQDIFGF